jgi:Protein of unknown function (DUF3224)
MPQTFLVGVAAALCLTIGSAGMGKEPQKMIRAAGTFDVKLTPQPLVDQSDPLLARMSIEKQFQGDLAGAGRAEMLAARTSIENSAGYVAIEKVTGTLGGKKGSFVLQHSGSMNRGVQHLEVTVVPDSGTGELAGITGTMSIRQEGGKHYYELLYSIGRP